MIPFLLRIETLAATAPGSGQGQVGVIDRDVEQDDLGLPLIGGRRLKGTLREAALEVCEALAGYPWAGANLLPVEELFGRGGEAAPGPFRIHDARPEEYASLQQWIGYWRDTDSGAEYFSREAVGAAYTELRAQTAIDPETGAAAENTLRVTRLIRPGRVFWAQGRLDPPTGASADWSERGLRTLFLACRSLRRLGLSRNRGPGRVDVRLHQGSLGSPVEYAGPSEADLVCQIAPPGGTP